MARYITPGWEAFFGAMGEGQTGFGKAAEEGRKMSYEDYLSTKKGMQERELAQFKATIPKEITPYQKELIESRKRGHTIREAEIAKKIDPEIGNLFRAVNTARSLQKLYSDPTSDSYDPDKAMEYSKTAELTFTKIKEKTGLPEITIEEFDIDPSGVFKKIGSVVFGKEKGKRAVVTPRTPATAPTKPEGFPTKAKRKGLKSWETPAGSILEKPKEPILIGNTTNYYDVYKRSDGKHFIILKNGDISYVKSE